MPKIMSFPPDCGLKQKDWIDCLTNDRNSFSWFVHENQDANIPPDLRSSDVVVLNGQVFAIWKRVILPFPETKPYSGYEVVYLAWRLTDDKD